MKSGLVSAAVVLLLLCPADRLTSQEPGKEGPHLPKWLRLGFRVYGKFVLSGDAAGTRKIRTTVKGLVRAKRYSGLAGILDAKDFAMTDEMGRDLCFSVVDYLFSVNPKRFFDLVKQLRAGTDTKVALREIYKKDFGEFEADWLDFVESKY